MADDDAPLIPQLERTKSMLSPRQRPEKSMLSPRSKKPKAAMAVAAVGASESLQRVDSLLAPKPKTKRNPLAQALLAAAAAERENPTDVHELPSTSAARGKEEPLEDEGHHFHTPFQGAGSDYSSDEEEEHHERIPWWQGGLWQKPRQCRISPGINPANFMLLLCSA